MKKRFLLIPFLCSFMMLSGCGEQRLKDSSFGVANSSVSVTNGKDGKSVLTGKGAPTSELGEDGDSYIDLDTYDFYGKSSGKWTKIGNLKGSNGKSAYELYIEAYPEYKGTEKQWLDDLVNGRLADKRKYKTIFYLNGEVYSQSEVKEGDYLVFPSTDPSKTGYTFDGWYLDSAFQAKVPSYYSVEEDTFLYAKMVPHTYTLTLHFEDETKDYSYTYGDPLTNLPATSKKGYSFLDWYVGENLTMKIEDYVFNDTTLKLDLYPKYAKNTYTATFQGIDEYGLAESTINFDVDNKTITLPSFEKDNHAVVAWRVNYNEYSPNETLDVSTLFTYSDWSNLTFAPVYGTYGLPSDYDIKEDDYGRYAITKYKGSDIDVTIPDYIKEEDGTYHHVTVIEKDAFKNSTVQFLTLSSSINTLKAESLSYATSLEKITIPSTVYTVENNIFLGDTSLTEVVYQTSAYPQSGSLFKLDNLKKVTFDTYSVPGRACAGCTNLEEIVLTEKVTSLGGYCFSDCSNVKDIVLPSSLNSTGFYSFLNSGITRLVIPDGISSISTSFRDCHNLEYVVLPKSVMSITVQAFCCDSGYKTFYKGTSDEFKSIAIDSDSTSIADDVYYYSDREPTDDGKYWHYVDNEPTVWTKSSTTDNDDTK